MHCLSFSLCENVSGEPWLSGRWPYPTAVPHPSKDLGPLAFNADASFPCNPSRSRSNRDPFNASSAHYPLSAFGDRGHALAPPPRLAPPSPWIAAVAPEDYSLFIDLFIRAGIWQSAPTGAE